MNYFDTQLTEQSFVATKDAGSDTVIGNFIQHLIIVNCTEKMKKKDATIGISGQAMLLTAFHFNFA